MKTQNQKQLHVSFNVQFKRGKQTFFLQPGQVIPVWDFATLTRSQNDVSVSMIVLAMDEKGELEPVPGSKALPMSHYKVASENFKCGANQLEDDLILQQARCTMLGGGSALATLRSSRNPAGLGLWMAPVSQTDARGQFEEQPITLSQAWPILNRLPRVSGRMVPLPRLYVKGPKPTVKGYDVGEGEAIDLVESLLPISPRPMEGLDAYDVYAAAYAHLKRIGGGEIYIGYDLSQEVTTDTDYVSAEDIRAGKGALATLYTTVPGDRDPYLGLMLEPEARMRAMLAGKDQLAPDVFPITGKAAVAVVDPLADLAQSVEAAFPVA